MTLQPQFTMLRTVPSTVVACWPCTALLNAGRVPRFCALAARGAARFPKTMTLKANIRAARTQFVVSGRKTIAVDGVADTGERRQKAGAILIRFSPGRGCSGHPCRGRECGGTIPQSNWETAISDRVRAQGLQEPAHKFRRFHGSLLADRPLVIEGSSRR